MVQLALFAIIDSNLLSVLPGRIIPSVITGDFQFIAIIYMVKLFEFGSVTPDLLAVATGPVGLGERGVCQGRIGNQEHNNKNERNKPLHELILAIICKKDNCIFV